MKLLDRLMRTGETKELRIAEQFTGKVSARESWAQGLSDADLAAQTDVFRGRLAQGQTLDDLLPDVFAVVRETARRVLGMRPYDVQVTGAVALHRGCVAQMRTGEGKTLVATMPAYLHALTGESVHVVTVNDYLASRDAALMGPVFEFLGMSVAVVLPDMGTTERQRAYAADVVYGTNVQFGFDYLRDHLATRADMQVQRGHAFAIVDEVDSILIDEARTPLIISGPSGGDPTVYDQFADLASRMRHGVHFEVDEQKQTISLTDEGIDLAEETLNVPNLYLPEHSHYLLFIMNAVRANAMFVKDRNYVVSEEGEVIIVDDNTGRLQHGRRYSDSLHQALEAKEGVTVREESRTLAATTLQSYFRMYDVLSGMTGTAETDAAEFHHVYKLPVVVIPTNRPMRRVDHSDLVFRTTRGKFAAIVAEIVERHKTGQPILVGTTSIEKSEYLSKLLAKAGIRHEVLNAKQHAREAQIVADAGRYGAVTIATNMAGRGTDIILGGDRAHREAEILAGYGAEPTAQQRAAATEQARMQVEEERQRVLAAGGLFILGTERNDARRIDDQLRGRAGRQGDPGETRFFLALDDDMMRVFSSGAIAKAMAMMNVAEDAPVEMEAISRAIQSAQQQVEHRAFKQRQELFTYDEVLELQRRAAYKQRDEVLHATEEGMEALWTEGAIEQVERLVDEVEGAGGYDIAALAGLLAERFSTGVDVVGLSGALDREELVTAVLGRILDAVDQTSAAMGVARGELMRVAFLNALDMHWQDHLDMLDQLRQGIGLRAIGQRNPKVEYARESSEMFVRMAADTKEFAVRLLLTANIGEFLKAQATPVLTYEGPSEV